jgi:hypothetical protein
VHFQPTRSRIRSVPLRAALPLITGLGYLLAALVPCPPHPAALAAEIDAHAGHASHSAAPHQHGAAESSREPSVAAPCTCGCDEAKGTGETGKRLGPVLASTPLRLVAPTAEPPARRSLRLRGELVDPIDPPIPIAA